MNAMMHIHDWTGTKLEIKTLNALRSYPAECSLLLLSRRFHREVKKLRGNKALVENGQMEKLGKGF